MEFITLLKYVPKIVASSIAVLLPFLSKAQGVDWKEVGAVESIERFSASRISSKY